MLFRSAAAKTSRLRPVLSYAGKLLSYPLKGALFGAGTAASLADMYNRAKAKDVTGATISGIGSGAALAAPFVSSMGALPAVAVAAPLYLAASDRLKHLQKHPEDYRLENARFDPLGNYIGGGLP